MRPLPFSDKLDYTHNMIDLACEKVIGLAITLVSIALVDACLQLIAAAPSHPS